MGTASDGTQWMVSAWTNHKYYNLSSTVYEVFSQRINDYAIPLGAFTPSGIPGLGSYTDPENPWFQFGPLVTFGPFQPQTFSLKYVTTIVRQLFAKFRPTENSTGL